MLIRHAMRWSLELTVAASLVAILPVLVRAEEPSTAAATAAPLIDLWPDGKMPGKGAAKPEELLPAKGDGVDRITNVSQPTLTLYRVPDGAKPAPAVIVCPGGGYGILAFNKEGTEIATWLNSLGVSALVLKYRVPGNRDGAFQDIQRAVRLVRLHQAEWHLDPAHIGVMGFSAGGHLCAWLSTDYRRAAYPASDGADGLSCRPDFTMLIYPAYLEKDGKLAKELPVDGQMPPTLIVHTEDDKKFILGSKVYQAALDAAKAPNEFQLFPTGGHGYGLHSKKDVSVWPQRAGEWLAKIGVL